MNIAEFYAQIPVERHREIVVSGDRLYFDGEEYLIAPTREGEEPELRLIHSHKAIEVDIRAIREERLKAIGADIEVIKTKLA